MFEFDTFEIKLSVKIVELFDETEIVEVNCF